jgi:hypothetical protein
MDASSTHRRTSPVAGRGSSARAFLKSAPNTQAACVTHRKAQEREHAP